MSILGDFIYLSGPFIVTNVYIPWLPEGRILTEVKWVSELVPHTL